MAENDQGGDALASINPDILAGVVETLSRLSGLDVGVITLDRPLGQEVQAIGGAAPLALDSLDLINVTMDLEEKFGIAISDDETDDPSLATVGGLALFVERKVNDLHVEGRAVVGAAIAAGEAGVGLDRPAHGGFPEPELVPATAERDSHDQAIEVLSTAIANLGVMVAGFTPSSMAGAIKRQLTLHRHGLCRLTAAQAEEETALEASLPEEG